MSGKNALSAFRAAFPEADSTFVGGKFNPDEILIVGGPGPKDPPLEEWNEDLWDAARLTMAESHPIDPEKLIATVEMGGIIDPISVVKRRDMLLVGSRGRRRVMGLRKANRILISRGATADEIILLDCVPDKSTDLEVSIRTSNEGRLDDPPYIKARTAARLRGRGKTDKQLAATFLVEPNSIANWAAYMHLAPGIQAQIEEGLKGDRLPFAVGVELAKGAGPEGAPGDWPAPTVDEWRIQTMALAFLRKRGAVLSGEKGRENAKLTVRACMRGELTPEQLADEITVDEPPPESATAPVPNPGQTPIPGHKSAPPPPPSDRGGSGGPRLQTAVTRLSVAAVREIGAHLEPSQNDPHLEDSDRLAHAIFQIITGQDPTAAGLSHWPRVLAKFQKVVRSPAAPKPKAPTIPLPETHVNAKAASAQTDLKIKAGYKKCPNNLCNAGVNRMTGKPCLACKGEGMISDKLPLPFHGDKTKPKK